MKEPIDFRLAFCGDEKHPLRSWMTEAGITNLLVRDFEFAEGKRACISIDNANKHADNTEWIGFWRSLSHSN